MKTTYDYTVQSGDSIWNLAKEYVQVLKNINKTISISDAQKEILALNGNSNNLVAGKVIKLPFAKSSPQPKSGYQKWQETIDNGISDSSWDSHDTAIKKIVTEYNSRLGKKTDVIQKPMPYLSWIVIKSMVWVESGGPTNPTWKTRPIQIGNARDAGYPALKKRDGASEIIMSDNLKKNLSQINTPIYNIEAGVAYLLTRLSISDFESVKDPGDKKEYIYTVVAGDNLSKIAKKQGTSLSELMKCNSITGASVIKQGQKLKYYKAMRSRVISDWRPFSLESIASRYNVNGDIKYAEKLKYVFNLLKAKHATNKKVK